eukprot:15484376-Alexandrium_andersonii.AAC.1
MAEVAFKKLRPIWRCRSEAMPLSLKLRVYTACTRAKLIYRLGTGWYTATQLNRLEAYHCRCLRRIQGIRSTYGAKLLEETP